MYLLTISHLTSRLFCLPLEIVFRRYIYTFEKTFPSLACWIQNIVVIRDVKPLPCGSLHYLFLLPGYLTPLRFCHSLSNPFFPVIYSMPTFLLLLFLCQLLQKSIDIYYDFFNLLFFF